MAREQFSEFVCAAIVSLPQDMKAFLRIVEDPEIDDESRVLAAGTLLHVLSGANALPGLRGTLAYVDDVLLMRVVLSRIAERSPEAVASHREEDPSLFESLEEGMGAAKAYLGPLMQLLDKAADEVAKISHKGQSAPRCVQDTEASNWLYEEVHRAIVERLEFDEEQVAREAKQIESMVAPLRSRTPAS